MERKDIRDTWINRSKEFFDEALVLFDAQMGNVLVGTKIYHSLVYTLFGLFRIVDPGSTTHAELIDKFENSFAGKDPLIPQVIDSLRSLYALVHTCGCPRPQEPDNGYVRTLFDITGKFRDFVTSLPE